MKRFFDSFWPTALFILIVLLASFSAELLSPLYPQWVFVSFSFIILTLGRYILTAMMGQRVSIDKHISTIDGVKYASLVNKDFVNVLEVKIFFELYENRKETLDPSELFLIRSDSVAISSISATPKKAKTNTIHIPVPEPILKLWNEKESSKATVFLKLGVTSVHYLTGYRRLYTETIA